MENNLGLGTSGLGSNENTGGLDLTGSFQSSGTLPTMPNTPTAPNFSGTTSFVQQPFQSNSPFAGSYGHDEHETQTAPQQNHGKDFELISAKLDAIRAQLDTLNLRIGTLEQRLPQQESGGPKKPWY